MDEFVVAEIDPDMRGGGGGGGGGGVDVDPMTRLFGCWYCCCCALGGGGGGGGKVAAAQGVIKHQIARFQFFLIDALANVRLISAEVRGKCGAPCYASLKT